MRTKRKIDKMRRKPTNELRASTHAATSVDYAILAQHVVSAIANKCRDLVIRLPYFAQMADDWPRGILIKKDSTHNYFKCKTFKVADWLHKHGHLPHDAKGIMKSMRTVNNLLGEIDRMLTQPQQEFLRNVENVIDSGKIEEYNSVSIEEDA